MLSVGEVMTRAWLFAGCLALAGSLTNMGMRTSSSYGSILQYATPHCPLW